MTKNSETMLMTEFPDVTVPGFDMEKYNQRFINSNVIIHAFVNSAHYDKHWGPLSIKCAFGGNEFYQVGNRAYSVKADRFLVMNEGSWYSSHIKSRKDVESFSINFNESFVKENIGAILSDHDISLTDPFKETAKHFTFTEKLHPLSGNLSESISAMRHQVNDFSSNTESITELFYLLLENLLVQQGDVLKEIEKVNVVRPSTRKELYTRLHNAKDYMDSCYFENVDLNKLSSITFMNPAYFLRQFKAYFKITPRQYLIHRRMETARELLLSDLLSITEVCNEVGYSDLTSFGKLFKQFYLDSPENFRRKAEVRA